MCAVVVSEGIGVWRAVLCSDECNVRELDVDDTEVTARERMRDVRGSDVQCLQ